jgi:hypothetical protein
VKAVDDDVDVKMEWSWMKEEINDIRVFQRTDRGGANVGLADVGLNVVWVAGHFDDFADFDA